MFISLDVGVLDALRVELQGRGVEVMDVQWGYRLMVIADPDGNQLSRIQRRLPPAPSSRRTSGIELKGGGSVRIADNPGKNLSPDTAAFVGTDHARRIGVTPGRAIPVSLPLPIPPSTHATLWQPVYNNGGGQPAGPPPTRLAPGIPKDHRCSSPSPPASPLSPLPASMSPAASRSVPEPSCSLP
jgi:hypothetical protein